MRRPLERIARFAAAVLAALVLFAGCAGQRPAAEPGWPGGPRPVVVFVPGITGSHLVHRDTGRIHWGTGHNLMWPRDGAYDLFLPYDDPRTDLVPGHEVREVTVLGLIRVQAYGPLRTLMLRSGFVQGDLARPAPDENFFFFSYDWRFPTARSAAKLESDLRRLQEARGGGPLHVTLVGQSSGGLIMRYFVKYGGATLERAEAGARPPDGIVVDKMLLIATSSGGALEVFHELLRGRRYIAGIGRRVEPEVLASFRSLFEVLPVHRRDVFFDGRGPLDVDLFDAANWKRFGWSAASPGSLSRLRERAGIDREEDVLHYLDDQLSRARRLHDLLRRDPPNWAAPRYYAIQSRVLPTSFRALLVEDDDGWQTRFHDERPVRRDPAFASLATAPGDGQATVQSQMWLSRGELEALARPTMYVEGGHFRMIVKAEAQRAILGFLAD